MAGWLDDFLKAQATGEPSAGPGLLAMLGLAPPQGWEPGWQGPKMPVPGSPGMTIPEVPGQPMPPNPAATSPAPPAPVASLPEQYAIPPQFQGGVPYFPPDVRGADIPGAVEPPRSAVAPIAAPAAAPDILGTIGRHIMQGLRDNSNSLIAGGGAMMAGGLGKGFEAMAAASPLDIAARRERQGNEAIKATYNALIAAGHSPAEALAGSQNPEILKTLVAKPTWGVTSEDFMGGKQYGFIDPITRTVMAPRAAAGAASQSAGLGSTIPNGADGQPIHGQELLSYLEKNSPLAAEGVKAIIAGDINAGGRNLQKLLPLAHMVDPTMNQADYQSRLKTRVEFGPSGKAGREIKSANTAITHANDLADLIPKLGTFTYLPWLNEPYNIARGQGSPDFQATRGQYDAKAESLAVELSKAFNGGVTSDADRQAWRAKLDAAKSPVELNAVVQSAMKQLLGRVNANAESYNQGMGTAREGIHFIDKNNVPVFNRLMGNKPDVPQNAASPAGNRTSTGVPWSVQ